MCVVVRRETLSEATGLCARVDAGHRGRSWEGESRGDAHGEVFDDFLELAEGVRFDEVLRRAQDTSAFLVLGQRRGRKDNDWKRIVSRLTANPFERFESIHERHFQIKDHRAGEIGAARLESVNEVVAIVAAAKLEGLVRGREAAVGKKSIVVTILSQQDVRRLEHQLE